MSDARAPQEKPLSLFIVPPRAQAKAASRQAMLAFRSLDPFRALREPDRRRRDEERLSRSEQRTLSKTKTTPLTGKAPYRFESLYPSERLLAGRHCRLAEPGRPTGSSPRIPCFEHLKGTCAPAGRPRRKSRGRLRFERQYRD